MQRRKYALLKQPFELDALGDVSFTNPVLGDVVYFDGTYWINTPYAELVDDRVNSLLVAGTGISLSYNDGANTLTVSVTDEGIDDRVNSLLQAGSNISLSYNDAGNTLTISAPVRTTVGATWVNGTTAVDATTAPQVAALIPRACTIKGVRVYTQGGTGSCVVDIWKDTHANYPPTVADSITASAKPTISSSNKYSDDTLTGWTVACSAGDVLIFKLDSSSTFTAISIFLILE